MDMLSQFYVEHEQHIPGIICFHFIFYKFIKYSSSFPAMLWDRSQQHC